MKSFLFFYLIFLVFVSSKLEMVIEFFRHGARGPNDADWNTEKWKDKSEINQLTEVGMRQTYILGREMRNKYIESQHFLSKTYNNKELYVRSTGVSRALQSAASHLYGLYPLGTGLELDPQFPLELAVPPYKNLSVNIKNMGHDALPKRFQPIEIHSLDKDKDMLLNYHNICPVYKLTREQQVKSKLYENFNLEFKELFEELHAVFEGSNEVSPWNITKVSRLATNIYADIYKNNPLPANLSESLWEKMKIVKELERQFVDVGSEYQRKFMGTPLFQEILKYFSEKIQNPEQELKYIMFSGHYLTLTPLMVGLNITNWECIFNRYKQVSDENLNCENGYPSYASQLILELHSNENQYFLKVIFNGNEMNVCEKNQKQCEFFEVKKRIEENIIMKDFNEFCQITKFSENVSKEKNLSRSKESKDNFIEKFSNFLRNANKAMMSSAFY